jgi:hypothetical protein
MGYFAQLDGATVARVVVCDDLSWLETRLGGVWVETADPYVQAGDVAYAGPGDGYDPNFPQRFARPWRQPVPGTDETFAQGYPEGHVVAHQGSLWVSTTAGNVWEPGVSAWHPAPTGGEPPLWIQPTGAHDAYRIGAKVRHKRPTGNPNVLVVWRCVQGDGAGLNVWEPGVFGWERV